MRFFIKRIICKIFGHKFTRTFYCFECKRCYDYHPDQLYFAGDAQSQFMTKMIIDEDRMDRGLFIKKSFRKGELT